MASIGTDAELLNANLPKPSNGFGRPKFDRDFGYMLIKAGKSPRYIRKLLGCSAKTIERMRKELEEKGELKPLTDLEKLEKSERKFDDECREVTGISFYEHLKNRTKLYSVIFSFCQTVWENKWGKPSLWLVKDRDNQLGDQLAEKFLTAFGEDVKRIRRRKVFIRYLFRFLGREDICNRNLTMCKARDPKEKRELPDIMFLDFPSKLEEALTLMEQRLGWEIGLGLRLKIVTQMRTGKADRELWGIRVGEPNGSYLIFNNPTEYVFRVHAKGNENWPVNWLPNDIREDLWQLYQTREKGSKLISLDVDLVRAEWKKATKEVGLPPLKLHDLRKVSITWLWVMGVDLTIATRINVGWTNTYTAEEHYLQCQQLLKKSDRLAYRERIPLWFKDGLQEYLPY